MAAKMSYMKSRASIHLRLFHHFSKECTKEALGELCDWHEAEETAQTLGCITLGPVCLGSFRLAERRAPSWLSRRGKSGVWAGCYGSAPREVHLNNSPESRLDS